MHKDKLWHFCIVSKLSLIKFTKYSIQTWALDNADQAFQTSAEYALKVFNRRKGQEKASYDRQKYHLQEIGLSPPPNSPKDFKYTPKRKLSLSNLTLPLSTISVSSDFHQAGRHCPRTTFTLQIL